MIGKVYKIKNTIDNMIYIGSTTQELNKRFSSHKSRSAHANSKLYRHMRALGPQHFDIELIEQRRCNRLQLRQLENIHIHRANTIVNGLNERCSVIDINQRKVDMRNAAIIAQHNNRITGKYRCDCCDVNFASDAALTRHYSTNRHMDNLP